MFLSLRRWFANKAQWFKYSKVEPSICFCGSSSCGGESSHSYVNEKDYYIYRGVETRLRLVPPPT
jgi:hypothetical protein